MDTLEEDIMQGISSMSFLSKPKFTRQSESAVPNSNTPNPLPNTPAKESQSTPSNSSSSGSKQNDAPKISSKFFPPPEPVFRKKEKAPIENPKNHSDYSDYSDSAYSSYSSAEEATPSKEKQTKSKSLEDYPTVTAELRNNLLQCSSDVGYLICVKSR